MVGAGRGGGSRGRESARGLESRMTHIAGFERDQLLLLPEAVDDYVEADNPVH